MHEIPSLMNTLKLNVSRVVLLSDDDDDHNAHLQHSSHFEVSIKNISCTGICAVGPDGCQKYKVCASLASEHIRTLDGSLSQNTCASICHCTKLCRQESFLVVQFWLLPQVISLLYFRVKTSCQKTTPHSWC